MARDYLAKDESVRQHTKQPKCKLVQVSAEGDITCSECCSTCSSRTIARVEAVLMCPLLSRVVSLVREPEEFMHFNSNI